MKAATMAVEALRADRAHIPFGVDPELSEETRTELVRLVFRYAEVFDEDPNQQIDMAIKAARDAALSDI